MPTSGWNFWLLFCTQLPWSPRAPGSHVPPLKKALCEISSWAFYLSLRLSPVSWALAWKKEEWGIIFTVEDILCPKSNHSVDYPVFLLESSLYAWASPQDKYFSRRFLHLPLKYAPNRSFHSSLATPRSMEISVDAATKLQTLLPGKVLELSVFHFSIQILSCTL